MPAPSAAGRTGDFAPASTVMVQAWGSPRMARGDREPRHRADRGQRLAAKAERADGEEIVAVELRGRMPLDREREVVAAHAGAVVGDPDQPPAAAVGQDIDAPRAGVERVLDQFLDDARRPLHHLAGGDAVDGCGIELADRHRTIHLARLGGTVRTIRQSAGIGDSIQLRQPRLLDGMAGLDGLVAPAMQQSQEPLRIGRLILERLAHHAGHQTRHQPGLKTEFDHRHNRAILIKGGEGAAQIVPFMGRSSCWS